MRQLQYTDLDNGKKRYYITRFCLHFKQRFIAIILALFENKVLPGFIIVIQRMIHWLTRERESYISRFNDCLMMVTSYDVIYLHNGLSDYYV